MSRVASGANRVARASACVVLALACATKLDSAFVDAIFPGFSYRLSPEQSLLSTMEGEARWAMREGHVTADRRMPNYLDYVEPGPLLRAVPKALQK